MRSSFRFVTRRTSVVVHRRFGQSIDPIFKGPSSPRRMPGASQPKGRSASRRPSVCRAVAGLSKRRLILKPGTALTLTIPHRLKCRCIHRMLWAVAASQGQQASQSGCSTRKKIRRRGDTRVIPVKIISGEVMKSDQRGG